MIRRTTFPGLLIALGMTALAGCFPSVAVRPFTSSTFLPTTHVEVFSTKTPNREYVEVAELSVKATDDEAIRALADKAKELGADAIILTGERTRSSAAVPVGGMLVAVPQKKLFAVAIKYK
jgi:hypothetical protein